MSADPGPGLGGVRPHPPRGKGEGEGGKMRGLALRIPRFWGVGWGGVTPRAPHPHPPTPHGAQPDASRPPPPHPSHATCKPVTVACGR